jgi:type IV secretion system protein VirD4
MNLVLGAAAAFVGASSVSWLAARLAARLFGDGPLRAGLVDAGVALTRLPRSPADPAAAWPAEGRDVLPGPIAYYACLATVVVAVVVAAVFAVRRSQRVLRPAGALGVRPHAGFARGRDLGRLTVAGPGDHRLVVGRVGHRLVACEPQASLAVVGPTGCGKTAGFAIPALLEWDGPVIATSVKADLLDATVAHRRKGGTVWVYDPTGSSGQEVSPWSPLAACRSWAGALRMSAWLSEAAQPRLDTVSDGDYWYTQARKGLAPYLYAAARSGKTMRDVVRWVDTQDQNEAGKALRAASGLEAHLEQAMTSDDAKSRREALSEPVRAEVMSIVRQVLRDAADGRAALVDRKFSSWPQPLQEQLEEKVTAEVDRRLRDQLETEFFAADASSASFAPLIAAKALWGKEERLRGSVFATMENVLAGYADPGVAAAAEDNAIDLDAWLAGNNTIYVVAAAHEQARLRPVLTVLVQQAIRAAYDRAAAAGGTLPRPCLVLLDEAGNIAPLRDLPGYASTARSHAITLVSIWQDLAQVKALYHDRAQTVLNNHRAKLFGTGIADEATLEYVSRLIGDEAQREQNRSTDLSGARRSVSEHTAYRRAAPVDVLRRIRPNEAVLLYGSELPAHVRLRPWFSDAALKRLAETASARPRRWPPLDRRPSDEAHRQPERGTP